VRGLLKFSMIWDNPNVFQICALREMGTECERRQTIGRGLRLCVNQQGECLRGFEINNLTVVATESHELGSSRRRTPVLLLMVSHA